MGRLVKTEVKYIQSLRQRPGRIASNAFVAEGNKLVTEILQNHFASLITLYATPQFKLPANVSMNNADLRLIDPSELERLSSMRQPQEALAVIKLPPTSYLPPPTLGWSLMLDNIQDPGNLGSIIRAADWFGVEHIYCSGQTADAFSSKVVQASMGSIFRVRMHYLDIEQMAIPEGLPLVVADASGSPLGKKQTSAAGVLVIGSEGQGVRETLRQRADYTVAIPRVGQAESLNAAMATGILLSHLTAP